MKCQNLQQEPALHRGKGALQYQMRKEPASFLSKIDKLELINTHLYFTIWSSLHALAQYDLLKSSISWSPCTSLCHLLIPTRFTRPWIHKTNVIWKLDLPKDICPTLCSKSCVQWWQTINYKRKETIGTYHRVTTIGKSEHLSATTPNIPERTWHTWGKQCQRYN